MSCEVHRQKMSSFTRQLFELEKTYSETPVGRILTLGVSLLLHAEAVCRAVYICFLSIKAYFSIANDEFVEKQKKECREAYRASIGSFFACFHQDVLSKIDAERQPLQLHAPIPVAPRIDLDAIQNFPQFPPPPAGIQVEPAQAAQPNQVPEERLVAVAEVPVQLAPEGQMLEAPAAAGDRLAQPAHIAQPNQFQEEQAAAEADIFAQGAQLGQPNQIQEEQAATDEYILIPPPQGGQPNQAQEGQAPTDEYIFIEQIDRKEDPPPAHGGQPKQMAEKDVEHQYTQIPSTGLSPEKSIGAPIGDVAATHLGSPKGDKKIIPFFIHEEYLPEQKPKQDFAHQSTPQTVEETVSRSSSTDSFVELGGLSNQEKEAQLSEDFETLSEGSEGWEAIGSEKGNSDGGSSDSLTELLTEENSK